ncbi:hypothetical protein AB9P05_16605 [Roseivirga sp. BDSF3-8]|uniref:hypothetical protein n=1 Tax=Roseivirga sp. BDSF3-8 TaxID=3241598 RepID=UPI003531B56F
MPKYNTSQAGLLIRLAAVKADVSLSSDGMKDLAIALEEDERFKHLNIEWTGRYLKERLIWSDKGTDPEFSEERINVLARFAGYSQFADYQSRYLSYSALMGNNSSTQAPIFLVTKKLYDHYQKELSPVINILDKTVPVVNSVDSGEEEAIHSKMAMGVKGGVIITTAAEPAPFSSLSKELKERWFVFIHTNEKPPIPPDWPAERVITSVTDLHMVTILLCSPGLINIPETKDPKDFPNGNTLSGTVHGTVFQGGVNIQQDNHGTGQQFVTSSDVHITNNNHYNQNT